MAEELGYLIGVDVGGTNTDVVIIEGNQVIGWSKVETTEDRTTGIKAAISEAIKNAREIKSGENIASRIKRVNIGTTHFVNAVIKRKDLSQVSVIRFCGTASHALPPFIDFPEDLRQVVKGSVHLVNGGYQFNGEEITPVNEEELKMVIAEIKREKITNVVLSGIFSPVKSDHEKRAAEFIKELYPEVSITLSHELGSIGLLERENAAILNESLKQLCKVTIKGFRDALDQLHLSCPFNLTQNDGTLISEEDAMKYPVHTFSSGPTNSMRGAAHLSGVKDAIVVDIGGTSTDVGVLQNGFPREASTRIKVGGVTTNFRMPDVLCIGLGGGSVVTKPDACQGKKPKVGPTSVENRIHTEALVFGGNVLTTSDVAVAAGLADFGDASKVAKLEKELCQSTLDVVRAMTESAIDQMKLSKENCPVILVGGGSVLIESSIPLEGVSGLPLKPPYFQVANAVGAALSQVSGTFDRFVELTDKSRDEAITMAKKEAISFAVNNGVITDTVKTVDISETEITYVTLPTARVKAVGDLEKYNTTDYNINDTDVVKSDFSKISKGDYKVTQLQNIDIQSTTAAESSTSITVTPKTTSNIPSQTPTIDPDTGEWILNSWDAQCLRMGAGIMGCGGGGSPYVGYLRLMKLIDEGKKVKVISPLRLKDKPGYVLNVAFMGAPDIMIEKLVAGNETANAFKIMSNMLAAGLTPTGSQEKLKEMKEKLKLNEDGTALVIGDHHALQDIKQDSNPENQVLAMMSVEIGGMNSIEPLILAAELGLPFADCDGMGRAFPELQHYIPFINGCPAYPAAIADDKGETIGIASVGSAKDLEDFFRRHTIRMGCSAGVSIGSLTAQQLMTTTCLFTVSRAWHIGNALLTARQKHEDPVKAVINNQNGVLLISGKIVNVTRTVERGFNFGRVIVEGAGDYQGKSVSIDFQNENLIVRDSKTDEFLVTAPDLITLVDKDTGEPVTTEESRYGLHVSVIVIPAMPIMRSPEALEVYGPESFGYKGVQYKSLCEYKELDPVPPGPST